MSVQKITNETITVKISIVYKLEFKTGFHTKESDITGSSMLKETFKFLESHHLPSSTLISPKLYPQVAQDAF